MKYKYIFFDWGHTLISKFKKTDDEINNILSKYGLNWEDIFKKWKNYQILYSLGRISKEEIYDELSLILKISKQDLKLIDNILLQSHILDDITRDIIIKLNKQGYYLGIITNNSISTINYILKREKIDKYFNKIVVSEQVNERKPNLKIYLKAFEDIKKEEYDKILFVSDELIEDLSSAMFLGTKTVWFKQNIDNKWKKKEQNIDFLKPDYIITKFEEILEILK